MTECLCPFVLSHFQAFNEELFSAKLFLTSALHEAILSLLSDDEEFLDVDPSKTAIRYNIGMIFNVDNMMVPELTWRVLKVLPPTIYL